MDKSKFTDSQREGVFHGQRGVDPALGLDRLAKSQELCAVQLGREMNGRVAQLRAEFATAQREATEARNRFAMLEAEVAGRVPSLVWPVLALLFAVALVIGDAFLCGPLMQAVGLTDPWSQRFVALLLGAGVTAFADLGFRLWRQGRKALSVFVLVLVAAAVGSVLRWRCDQIVFAASLGNPAWRGFLAQHPMSTRLFVIGLGTILPFAAGFVSSHSLPELEFATRWRWARYQAEHGERKCDLLGEQYRASEVEARLAVKDIVLQHEVQRAQYRIGHSLGRRVSRNGTEVSPHA